MDGAAKKVTTRQIRASESTVELLQWIAELEGKTMAEAIDEIALAAIKKRYARVATRAEIIKAARMKPTSQKTT